MRAPSTRLRGRLPHLHRRTFHVIARYPLGPAAGSRPPDGRHRQLRRRLHDRFDGGVRHRALHAARFAGLRDARDEVSGVRQAPRSSRSGRRAAGWREGAGHRVGARSRAGRVQHRRAGALARFQRHLARGRVGTSVGQSRRDPRGRRLPVAQGRARRRQAADRARRARLRDQGARDPGLLCAEELVQSRRPRSCDPRATRLDRCCDAHARRQQGRHRQRGVAQLDRQRRPAHVPPRAEYRSAQELGGGRCVPARGDACAERSEGLRRLSVGAERENVGFLRRRVQGQSRSSSSVRSAAT